MPFDGESCWTFYVEVGKGRVTEPLLSRKLWRHADQCVCPCPPCRQLRDLWLLTNSQSSTGDSGAH